MRQYDVVIVGLGIMGSASLWQLTRAGARVLGIEAGGPSHCKGSSHGATRIFRRAYWEGASYLPLLNLAHEGWQLLQSSTDRRLMIPTGGVFIGPRQSDIVAGSLHTAIAANIEHSQWDAAAMRRKLPQFSIEDGMHAVVEPGAYVLASEQARAHMLNESVQCGAELRYGDAVAAISRCASGLTLTTRAGHSVGCKTAVVTTGAWLASQLLPELSAHLMPKRVPIYWFSPKPGLEQQFAADVFPVFLYECSDGTLLYGIPAGTSEERGVKIGFHNRQQLPCDPDTPTPPLTEDLRLEIARHVGSLLPGLASQPIDTRWCIYTMSSDESFLIGPSQRIPGVFYASACSGHGFKFAPGIGSVLACLALGTAPPIAIDHFFSSRFDARMVPPP